MDDDSEFEDLLAEADLLNGSSQASLTDAATNMTFDSQVDFDSWQQLSPTNDNLDDDPTSGHDRRLSASPILPLADTSRHEESNNILKIYPNAAVIAKIERVFEDIADALLNEKDEVGITLKTHTTKRRSSQGEAVSPTKRTCFPGKSAEEAWRFAVIMRILELMHEGLRNDAILSKRDIYYRDPALFGSQTHVDRYVDNIAFTFGVTRTALNVTAVAKGLLAGAATFYRRDGTTLSANVDREGVLVPSLKNINSVDMTAMKWILVIEKEATFRTIIASEFWQGASDEGLILTGKGYPDLASRALLRFLGVASVHNAFSSPPVFGLADFDPDGISILSIYRDGSSKLAHETAGHRVPQLQRLGLSSEDLASAVDDLHVTQGILSLTKRDRKKAVSMLDQLSEEDDLSHAKRELQVMLMLNMKAELQLLEAQPGGISGFLSSRLNVLRASHARAWLGPIEIGCGVNLP